MKTADLYKSVTQSIIAELEKGAAPWVKPWKGGKRVGIMPANAITGHHYHGINVPILWHAADVHGFPTNAWLTFKQALDAGGHVKKGEKGTQVVFTKRLTVKDEDDENRQISMLRSFTVFNVEQVEGIEMLSAFAEPPLPGAISAFVQATGAEIRHGGDMACYVPLSLSEIISEDIGGVVRRELVWEQCVRPPEWRAVWARPCSPRGGSVNHCNTPCKKGARGADAAR